MCPHWETKIPSERDAILLWERYLSHGSNNGGRKDSIHNQNIQLGDKHLYLETRVIVVIVVIVPTSYLAALT